MPFALLHKIPDTLSPAALPRGRWTDTLGKANALCDGHSWPNHEGHRWPRERLAQKRAGGRRGSVSHGVVGRSLLATSRRLRDTACYGALERFKPYCVQALLRRVVRVPLTGSKKGSYYVRFSGQFSREVKTGPFGKDLLAPSGVHGGPKGEGLGNVPEVLAKELGFLVPVFDLARARPIEPVSCSAGLYVDRVVAEGVVVLLGVRGAAASSGLACPLTCAMRLSGATPLRRRLTPEYMPFLLKT